MNSPLPSGTGGPSPDSQWLVCCSPERTLVARLQGGETRLVKIFERGSAADAEREAFLARTLAQPGVVRYLDAGLDPVTRKPCVTMEFAEGENLVYIVLDKRVESSKDPVTVEKLEVHVAYKKAEAG